MRLIDGYARPVGLTGEYREMTRSEVRSLSYGDRVTFIDNDGRVRYLKINGRIRTYKRDPERIEIPVKYGWRETATLYAHNMGRLVVRIPDPVTYEDLAAGESAASGKVQ